MTNDATPAKGAPRTTPRWSRIVLKLSGEALAEPNGFGLDSNVLHQIATELHEAVDEFGVDIAIVVGGGNFWRGLKGAGQGMDQAQADYMGMIATVMNGLALQDALERVGQHPRTLPPSARRFTTPKPKRCRQPDRTRPRRQRSLVHNSRTRTRQKTLVCMRERIKQRLRHNQFQHRVTQQL